MDRRHPARLIRHTAQRTCRRSMRTATAALGTTMSRPSSLAGSHRVSLPISSQGAAKDCALSLTWSGRAAENAGLLKRQHRSRSQRRFPEDALVANVGCRRRLCENTQELTRRRIVFSIALFPTAATALFIFKLTKSRRIFYAKIERLCFHTAWSQKRQGEGARALQRRPGQLVGRPRQPCGPDQTLDCATDRVIVC